MIERKGRIVEEVPGLYRVIALEVLRRTKKVDFDLVPMDFFPSIAAIDRVVHGPGALSPGTVGPVDRPWYWHPHQEDHLLVLAGSRSVELYTPGHGRIETICVGPDGIRSGGRLVHEGGAILAWPIRVFHRIVSDPDRGSASINLAVRRAGFDLQTNFDIYDLDPVTNGFRVIREGHLDQPGPADNG